MTHELTTVEPSVTVDPPALAAETLPADMQPAAVYLKRLAPGSRPAMEGALRTIAAVLAPGWPPETLAAFPWHRLHYQHTQAVRTALAARFAPATANRMLCALRGVLGEAEALGLMSVDDCRRASNLAAVRGSRLPRGRALAGGELRLLFAQATARDAAILALGYGCGLRRSELVGLDLGDVSSVSEGVAVPITVRGKGNKERVVYATNGGDVALRAWIAVRGSEPGPLFVSFDRSHRGKRMTPEGIRVALRRMAVRAGVAKFSPHDLRRTFVGDMLDAGADLAAVQSLAGHASPTTTARYDRRGERARLDAARRLRLPLEQAMPIGLTPKQEHDAISERSK